MMAFELSHEGILFIISGAILLTLFLWLARLERRISLLLQGKGEDEDVVLGAVSAKAEEAIRRIQNLEITQGEVEKRLSRSIQGVETIRFNPFKEAGSGNQSFASAFLSEEGEGVIISTLYSRDRVGVFGKPIENFSSPFELTVEEAEALERAAKNIRKQTTKK